MANNGQFVAFQQQLQPFLIDSRHLRFEQISIFALREIYVWSHVRFCAQAYLGRPEISFYLHSLSWHDFRFE